MTVLCNRCNEMMASVAYCPNCGCPESRLMKPLRTFVTMVRPDCQEQFVKHIQALCAEPFVQDLIKVGAWEFQIEPNKSTGWLCLFVEADYEIWKQIDVTEMRVWLEERTDRDELREVFPDCYCKVPPSA